MAKITKIHDVARRRHQECHCANIASIWVLCIGIDFVVVVVKGVKDVVVDEKEDFFDLLYFFLLQQLLLNI